MRSQTDSEASFPNTNLHFISPKPNSPPQRCFPKDISKSAACHHVQSSLCLGTDAKRGKVLYGKEPGGFREPGRNTSPESSARGSHGRRCSAAPPRCAAPRSQPGPQSSAPAPRPQSAGSRGAEERGAGSAYLRLRPARALPAPAVGGQPGARLHPRPPGRRRAPHTPTCVSRRRGRAARCLRRRRCRRGQSRADWRELAATGCCPSGARGAPGSGVESEGRRTGRLPRP